MFLIGIWSLYGVAALLKIREKNTMYNMLDVVSKNFYGLLIYAYIRGVGQRKGQGSITEEGDNEDVQG